MARSFWSIAWGAILIVLGGLLLLDRLGYKPFDLGEFLHTWWPLVLIILGLSMLVDHRHDRHRSRENSEDKRGEEHDRT